MTKLDGNTASSIEALFKISYGLYVVSSKHEDKLNGYVSNAVFQVTAEPAQFAVCCSKNNFTAQLINGSRAFSVSVLKKDTSQDLIGVFGYQSGKDTEKFKGVKYITGSTGSPILIDDTVAWFECRVVNTVDVGTHLLFTAEIVASDIVDSAGEPLTYSYYREVRKGRSPKNAPTYIEHEDDRADSGTGKYKCLICGHIYDPSKGDPDHGVAAGTEFSDIGDDWQCPVCGTDKGSFDLME